MPTPIKVLHVVHSLGAGGMENGVVNIINGLEGDSFKFSIACLTEAGAFRDRLQEAIPIAELHKPNGLSPGLVRRLKDVITREQADIVHTHNWATLVYSVPAVKLAGKGKILHGEHAQLTTGELTPRRLWIRRLLYRFTSLVHTVSKGQRDELVNLGFPPKKVLAIINGVDTDRFAPTPGRSKVRHHFDIPADALVLGLVGRFGEFKRHAEMIDAFEQLAETVPTLHLLFAGAGGPNEKATRSRVASSPYQNRIVLSGFLSDPRQAYQAMDLLVVPSVNEGLSNASLEAMASRVPVLAHHACGSAELFSDTKGGRVADLSTVPRLTKAIESMITDPTSLAQQGQPARDHAERHFSLKAMLQNYRNCYEQVAKDGPLPIPQSDK